MQSVIIFIIVFCLRYIHTYTYELNGIFFVTERRYVAFNILLSEIRYTSTFGNTFVGSHFGNSGIVKMTMNAISIITNQFLTSVFASKHNQTSLLLSFFLFFFSPWTCSTKFSETDDPIFAKLHRKVEPHLKRCILVLEFSKWPPQYRKISTLFDFKGSFWFIF